ncbi:hypothetical protein OAE80_01200 [Planctomycetaceae bacterium]|jgi:hypothetical protein|nr:hypothetical protein [Planctomycetaceae bacterium]
MTWGASLIRLPEGMTIAEMKEQFGSDWQVPAVGTLAEVKDGLSALFPHADHSDGQTNFEDGYVRVQFNYIDRTGNGIIESIGVNSNGDSDSIPVLKRVCEHFGLRMVDHQSGELADFSSGTIQSMKDFSAFRDRNWKLLE